MYHAGSRMTVRRTWRRWLLIGLVVLSLALAAATRPDAQSDSETPAYAGPIDGGNG